MGIWPTFLLHVYHLVRHAFAGLDYKTHCTVIYPRHFRPVPVHHWEYVGRMVCWIWDKAGTMHPR